MPRKAKLQPETPPILERPPLPRPTPVQMEQMMNALAGDTRFQLFIEQVRLQREAAISDICLDAVVENHAKLAAAVGEIRTYSGIIALADSHIDRRTNMLNQA